MMSSTSLATRRGRRPLLVLKIETAERLPVSACAQRERKSLQLGFQNLRGFSRLQSGNSELIFCSA
jgi:hypothetical protein